MEINGEPLRIPAMLPKLSTTPGTTEWPGAEVASHSDEILQGLGLDGTQIESLKQRGIVADSGLSQGDDQA